MKDESLMRAKFAEIINDTSLDYPPLEEQLNELNDFFNSTLERWDRELKYQGVETLLADFKTCIVGYKAKLWKIEVPKIPNQYTKKEKLSHLFYWAAMIKLGEFFIEYLEKSKKKKKNIAIIPFEEMFIKPEYAEMCLNILKQMEPPIIDNRNNYIGRSTKGVFPLWIDTLRRSQLPLINHLPDTTYAAILNSKIKGLGLSKDAKEFRTNYTTMDERGLRLEMATKLSYFIQKGKLGK